MDEDEEMLLRHLGDDEDDDLLRMGAECEREAPAARAVAGGRGEGTRWGVNDRPVSPNIFFSYLIKPRVQKPQTPMLTPQPLTFRESRRR